MAITGEANEAGSNAPLYSLQLASTEGTGTAPEVWRFMRTEYRLNILAKFYTFSGDNIDCRLHIIQMAYQTKHTCSNMIA